MPNNQSKQLAQGAMMGAVFAVLLAIGYYVPVLWFVTSIIAPLPIAWYSASFERSQAILMAIVAIVITFFFGGLLIMPSAILFGVAGIVIGDAIRLKKSKLYLFISTSISLLIVLTMMYVISLRLLEVDFIKVWFELWSESFIQGNKISEQVSGQVAIPEDQLNLFIDTFNTIVPAIITIAVALLALALISINLPLLKRFNINVPKFSQFKSLRLPKAVLWYYLIVLIITIFVNPEVGTPLYVIILNFSVVLWILLTLQGVSFIYFVIDEKKLPKFLKVLTAFFSIPFYSIVLLIGVFDLGFEIRQFITAKKDK